MSVYQDWIEFEEIADLEERAKSHFFEKENEEEVQKSQAAAKEKEFLSVKATKDQVGEVRPSVTFSPALMSAGDHVPGQTCDKLNVIKKHVVFFCSCVKSVRSRLKRTGWRKRRTGS